MGCGHVCKKGYRMDCNSSVCSSCKGKLNVASAKIFADCYRCTEHKICSLTMYNRRFCEDCAHKVDPRVRGHGTKSSWCHDAHSECQLSAASRCCFCVDRRSYLPEGMYSGYIDGIGFAMNKNRWDFYCSHCKDYYNAIKDTYLCDIGMIEGSIATGAPSVTTGFDVDDRDSVFSDYTTVSGIVRRDKAEEAKEEEAEAGGKKKVDADGDESVLTDYTYV